MSENPLMIRNGRVSPESTQRSAESRNSLIIAGSSGIGKSTQHRVDNLLQHASQSLTRLGLETQCIVFVDGTKVVGGSCFREGASS